MKMGKRKTLTERLVATIYKGDAGAFHKPVKLSLAEWSEIYYALDSKAMQLRNGDFGESDENCDVDVWADMLDAIMTKIGPDGRNMVDPKEIAEETMKCRHHAVDALMRVAGRHGSGGKRR